MSFISSYQKIFSEHEGFTKKIALITKEEQETFQQKIQTLNTVKRLSYESFSAQKSRQELFSLVGSSLSYLQAAILLSFSYQIGLDNLHGQSLALCGISDLVHQTVKNSCGWGAFYALYDPKAPQEIKESFRKKMEGSLDVLTMIGKLYHGMDTVRSLDLSSFPTLAQKAQDLLQACLPFVQGAHEIGSALTTHQLEKIRQEITELDSQLRMLRMNEQENLELLKKALDETSEVISLFSKLCDQIASTTIE